ncbi:Protein R10D12.13 a [Aphelenchoides avenae]|nr:Protein R10D12.13 a [Aphelenchus avenae]
MELTDAVPSSSALVTTPTEEDATVGVKLAASDQTDTTQAETSSCGLQFDKDGLFRRIAGHGDKVFYKHQQRGEADLTEDEKLQILEKILSTEPTLFLERYHSFISPDFLHLFPNPDGIASTFIKRIKDSAKADAAQRTLVRNRRFAELLKLRKQGNFFSKEKMREREPLLFDMMVGKYLDDRDKLHLRPTVDSDSGMSAFTGLLQQFEETQQISDRRKRHLTDWQQVSNGDATDRFLSHVDRRTADADDQSPEEFEMEFDSSDEEGRAAEEERKQRQKKRHCARSDETVVMKNFMKAVEKTACFEVEEESDDERRAVGELATMKVTSQRLKPQAGSEYETSGDEDERQATGVPRESLYDEFVSIMEERFLSGKDGQFFDYSKVDTNENDADFRRIHEQDLEDAYFADSD